MSDQELRLLELAGHAHMSESQIAADWILQASTNEELRSRIKSYLDEQRFNLPLWELCHDGGRPEVIEISVDHVERVGKSVSAVATVEFLEAVPASCGVRTNRDKSCTLRVEAEGGEIRVSVESELWDGIERGEW
ncbi:MAG: hypothetical protein U0872_10070 [Planctomycetaceae bacterium]